MEACTLARTALIICSMAVLGVAGFASDRLIHAASRYFLRWTPQQGRPGCQAAVPPVTWGIAAVLPCGHAARVLCGVAAVLRGLRIAPRT